MNINFKNKIETKEMYQVGNVIKQDDGSLYLAVSYTQMKLPTIRLV